jgi:hypothetical protein
LKAERIDKLLASPPLKVDEEKSAFGKHRKGRKGDRVKIEYRTLNFISNKRHKAENLDRFERGG